MLQLRDAHNSHNENVYIPIALFPQILSQSFLAPSTTALPAPDTTPLQVSLPRHAFPAAIAVPITSTLLSTKQ